MLALGLHAQEANVNAISSQQATADAIYYDAVKANIQGETKVADSLFHVFAMLKPEIASTYYELSKIYIKQNKEEKAIENIKLAIKLDDNNKWYKLEYAEILAGAHEYQQAAELYEKIAETENYNQDYLFKAASYFKLAEKYKEALRLLDKLMLQVGPDEDILIQKQQIYLKLNDQDKAAQMIELLIKQNPKESKYYAWLAEMYDNANETKKAEAIFKQAADLFPDDAAIEIGLAEHFRKQNDSTHYKEYVRKAILNKYLDPETQIQLMVPYLQEIGNDSLRRTEGLLLTLSLIKEHPDNSGIIAIYGEALAMNNYRDSAAKEYKLSISYDPSRFLIWQKLLECYLEKKDADSLLKYADKALKVFPNQAIVHFYKGIALSNQKNYTQAVRSINRAIDMLPDEDKASMARMYSTLGDIFYSLKQFNLSDSCFDKSLALDPNQPFVLNNYSYYLSERGVRLDDAERMSEKSLSIVVEASFLDTYGWILFKKGAYEKARTFIQKAVDANPDAADGTLFEHLGDVNYKLNDIDKAVDCWKKAKEKGLNEPLLDKKIQDRKWYEQ